MPAAAYAFCLLSFRPALKGKVRAKKRPRKKKGFAPFVSYGDKEATLSAIVNSLASPPPRRLARNRCFHESYTLTRL